MSTILRAWGPRPGIFVAMAAACLFMHCATTAPNPSDATQRSSMSFKSGGAPKAQSAQALAPTQFALIGDFGQSGQPEEQVAGLVHSWQPEFIVTLGDNNYPNGAEQTIDENIGRYYGAYIKGKQGSPSTLCTSATQRFFPTLGNHDWRAQGAMPYLNYFDLPNNGRYYRVVRGPVELFIIDSDPHEPDGVEQNSVQAQWLRAALADSNAPWKLVILHHPPYSSGRHGSSTWMQWPYKAWGASAVLSGHDHTYEHVVMDGMNYIVMGLSGASKDHFRVACALPKASLDSCFDDNYGALRARADQQVLSLQFITIDGRVQDTVTLQHAGN